MSSAVKILYYELYQFQKIIEQLKYIWHTWYEDKLRDMKQ